jgi:molecular chaperone GrpE
MNALGVELRKPGVERVKREAPGIRLLGGSTVEITGEGKSSQSPAASAEALEPHEVIELQMENERLKTENERVRSELRREHEMHIRALADFDNYRLRIDRERDAAAREGSVGLMRSLLDVIDDLESALKDESSRPETILDYLRATYHRLLGMLEGQGATPFESVGQPFDPARHEAVEEIESEQEPGTVLHDLRRGWSWGRDLLRPARVRIAR